MTNLKSRIAHKEEVGKLLKPIVVGGDILAYSYVRELNRAFGIEKTIVLAAADIKMLSTSRFTDYRLIPDVHDAEVLYATLEGIAAEFARENPNIVPMVFGCDDCHARVLSEAKPRLEAAGIVVPYIDFDLLDDITQKRRFYELCEELDIPYPKTWYFDCSDAGPDELPLDELPFPLIAKPSNSAQFQDAEPTVCGWRKIYEIEDAAEMAEVWKSLRESSYNNLMVLQDFIPGSDDAIRTLTTFSNAEGEVRCVSGGVVCLQDHDPTAIGNPLCILGERENTIVECAKRFVKRVGYCGMANFDIKLDERDEIIPLLRGEHALRPQHLLHEPWRAELHRAHGSAVRSRRGHSLPRGLRSVRLLLRTRIRAEALDGEQVTSHRSARAPAREQGVLSTALCARHRVPQPLGEDHVHEPNTQVQKILLGYKRQAAEVAIHSQSRLAA